MAEQQPPNRDTVVGARAVGGALGKNNLMMAVPCHRVVGSDGKLTGFTSVGGLSTKRNLLNIEQKTKK